MPEAWYYADKSGQVGPLTLQELKEKLAIFSNANDVLVWRNDSAGNFQTDVVCPGPNSVKVGSTATACVTGFESCLKGCEPGSYGFRQAICSNGLYANGGGCAGPSDATIAPHFSGTNATSATQTETNNAACTTEWAWATDGAGKYCMCVPKPGYYQQSSGWWVWDCQSQWW